MKKICIVITARPSYSRIKSVLRAINEHKKLSLQLVVTGSALLDKYGSVINNIVSDGFNPVSKVHVVVEGEDLLSSAKTTGMGIVELAGVFNSIKPDAVISVADRFETMSTAIASAYQNIPLIHIQGGEITGSIDEKVRHAVTKLSDLHFVSNSIAAMRLKKMGENPNKIFISGCPSIDLANNIKNDSTEFKNLKIKGVGFDINLKNPYLVVMQHPVTYEWDEASDQLNQTLEAIKELNMPTFWFWPNIDAGSDRASRSIRIFREENKNIFIRFVKNLSPEKFLNLLINSKCLIGNSSVGIRECSFLGVPVVNIGSRQLGRDRAQNVVDVNYNSKEIIDSIKHQISNGFYQSSNLYGNGNAGKEIANIISKTTFTSEKKLTY